MALRVRILRFDRLAPLADDVKERSFDAERAAIDVAQVVLGTQISEQPVRVIQVLHGFAKPSLPAEEIRALARDFRFEQHVLALPGERISAVEVSLGDRVAIGLARNNSELLQQLRLDVLVSDGARPAQ